MAKVAVFAKITARPGQLEPLVEAAEVMVRAVDEESGTEIYALNVDRDQGALWFYELYTDQDAFNAHAWSDVMRTFGVIPVTPQAAKGLNFS
jgi:quinol monooxygenase YgiN